jgi:parallel beta-helix repeat protein
MSKSVVLLLVLFFIIASSIVKVKPALSSAGDSAENTWVSSARDTFLANSAKANIFPPPPEWPSIYIKSDGSIKPSTAPIQRTGRTYTLTENITNYTIEIQNNDVVLDGAGFSLQGNGIGRGVSLKNIANSTVKNLELTGFRLAVEVLSSSGNNITQNTITDSGLGVYLSSSSSNNTIVGNKLRKCSTGIIAYGSSHNSIVENQIIENDYSGIQLTLGNDNTPSDYANIIRNNITSNKERGIIAWSSNSRIEENTIAKSGTGILLHGQQCSIIGNTIVNNTQGIHMGGRYEHNMIARNLIADNEEGIRILASNNSKIYHNNFVNNLRHVGINLVDRNGSAVKPSFPVAPSLNVWDNGEEGNYWSNYTGRDSNNDGIGDAYHVLDANNLDRYPLMEPFGNIETPDGKDATTSVGKPFPTTLVTAASVATVVVVGAGLLVYFKKRKH